MSLKLKTWWHSLANNSSFWNWISPYQLVKCSVNGYISHYVTFTCHFSITFHLQKELLIWLHIWKPELQRDTESYRKTQSHIPWFTSKMVVTMRYQLKPGARNSCNNRDQVPELSFTSLSEALAGNWMGSRVSRIWTILVQNFDTASNGFTHCSTLLVPQWFSQWYNQQ